MEVMRGHVPSVNAWFGRRGRHFDRFALLPGMPSRALSGLVPPCMDVPSVFPGLAVPSELRTGGSGPSGQFGYCAFISAFDAERIFFSSHARVLRAWRDIGFRPMPGDIVESDASRRGGMEHGGYG